MTKKKKVAGMLAMVLVFGMSVAGCGRESGGTFTMTNIPSEFNGMYAGFFAEGRRVDLVGAQRVSISRWDETLDLPRISGGRVRIPVWIFNDDDSVERYNGNHTVELSLIISNSATIECCCDGIAEVYFDSVTFSNGSATRSWRDADSVDRW